MIRIAILCLLFPISFLARCYSQVKIGNNPTTINANSLLELESSSQGLVPPRLSLTSVSSYLPLTSTLYDGTIVYNTNAAASGGSGIGLYIWYSSKWNFLGSNLSTVWSLTGNSGTTPSSASIGSPVNHDFIGTTDSKDLVVATNNLERMRVSSSGKVGIGTNSPAANLDVNGNFKLGSSGTSYNNLLHTTITVSNKFNFDYTSSLTLTYTVSGVTQNASIIANPESNLPSGYGIGWVRASASNKVAINFTNTGNAYNRNTTVVIDLTILD